MEQDYKEQLRMMTEGLGEWMDRREREQRRRRRWLRVALGVVNALKAHSELGREKMTEAEMLVNMARQVAMS